MDDSDKTPLLTPCGKNIPVNTEYSAINPQDFDTPLPSEDTVSYAINREELPLPDANVQPKQPKVSSIELRVYKRRWYILLLFSFVSGTQALIWNTWSPISDSAQKAFGWNNGDISLLANWGPISNISIPIFAWMLETKGLRWSVIVAMVLVTLGSGVRCIPTTQPSIVHKCLMNTGQLLNGLGGPVATGAMPLLSATWFPPHERATATAVPFAIKLMSIAGSFIFGPFMVPEVPKQNGTEVNLTTISDDNYSGQNYSNKTGVTVEQLKTDITFYLELQTGIASVMFLLLLVYFPKKPPTPPCISASKKREPFFQGLKQLLRIGNFWLMTLISALQTGVGSTWMSVLSLVLIPVGVSQREAGWIGFYALLSTGGIMLIIGRVGDVFARHMKWFISALFLVAAVSYILFGLTATEVIPFYMVCVYISIIGGHAANATIPLVVELACDLAYPVGEGTSSLVLMAVSLACMVVFLFLMMIPSIGTMWLTWVIIGAMSISTVLVLMVKEKHHRLDIDITVQQDNNDKGK